MSHVTLRRDSSNSKRKSSHILEILIWAVEIPGIEAKHSKHFNSYLLILNKSAAVKLQMKKGKILRQEGLEEVSCSAFSYPADIRNYMKEKSKWSK